MNVFTLYWWQVLIFALFIDWGAIRLVRRIEPIAFRFPHWSAGAYGDLFLPFGVATTATVARDHLSQYAWYGSTLWSAFILSLGVVLITALNVQHARLLRSVKQREMHLLAPHELWHDLVFVLLFYIIGTSAVPFWLAPKPMWAIICAVIGYGGWSLTELYDLRHPQIRQPGRRSR